MKAFITLLFILLFIHQTLVAQTKTKSKFQGTPFQGTKEFCDYLKPLHYKVSILGYNVTITRYYNKEKPGTVQGIYKKGKLFTNDPVEKKYYAKGIYYKIYPSALGINNLEGGDYEYFEECK